MMQQPTKSLHGISVVLCDQRLGSCHCSSSICNYNPPELGTEIVPGTYHTPSGSSQATRPSFNNNKNGGLL